MVKQLPDVVMSQDVVTAPQGRPVVLHVVMDRETSHVVMGRDDGAHHLMNSREVMEP